MTQYVAARAGEITPEMEFVAKREQLEPTLIRDEVVYRKNNMWWRRLLQLHRTKFLEVAVVDPWQNDEKRDNIGNS